MSDAAARRYLAAMQYRSAEDRLNPITPEGADDTTIGGYATVHGRAAGLESTDGKAYTLAVETEPTDDPDAPWAAFLIFLEWADTGSAIMGHLESEDLARGASEAEVRAAVDALPLHRAQSILDQAVLRRQADD